MLKTWDPLHEFLTSCKDLRITIPLFLKPANNFVLQFLTRLGHIFLDASVCSLQKNDSQDLSRISIFTFNVYILFCKKLTSNTHWVQHYDILCAQINLIAWYCQDLYQHKKCYYCCCHGPSDCHFCKEIASLSILFQILPLLQYQSCLWTCQQENTVISLVKSFVAVRPSIVARDHKRATSRDMSARALILCIEYSHDMNKLMIIFLFKFSKVTVCD